ncbi:28S ribosomal protein S15, mitochondrial-like [Teleopsis dalmanni]|uniref:28S ribosomal protein S15, mitochondrial-like n=1 Tax=Teleopsis dalmanni TaxID=139649 RepID=UPI0018CD12FD|nr:28S ribosomal protein S15, mitochondrial-like [Teleopsis dalmanni]
MNICNLVKTTINVQKQLTRQYAFKSDLKIKWVRPEKISCIKPEKSGDCTKLPPLNPQEYIPEFQNSKELENADPIVQSIFQMGNCEHHYTSRHHRLTMIKEVQRHSLDYGSMEAKLARMTGRIRSLQEYMEKFPRDKKKKVILKELIDKRKKFLKYLRRWDYARFEWILEKLDLVYKPPPEYFHWITRKESLQKLTNTYCENIKEARLEEYRKKLEDEQIPFLEEAIKQLSKARQDQIDCDVPITITEEKINEMKIDLENLKVFRASNMSNKNGEDLF